MTIRKYMFDKSLEGTATIITSGNDGRPYVELDSTLMHVQGGGQPSDVGTIEDIKVNKVVNVGEEIRHYVDFTNNPIFFTGQNVRIQIDKEHRILNSKFHSGGHLIAAISEAIYPQLSAVGGHHWPGEARVEFCAEHFPDTDEFSSSVQNEIMRTIDLDLPVTVIFNENKERSVSIGDFPDVGCGGTHVERLSELDGLKITKVRVKAGKLRVSYSL